MFQPGHPLADEDGFRTDILEAARRIRVPVMRWPGGCFVSAYHWKDGVGKCRRPAFDKAWRVEDPNTFGTDEYIRLCRKLGCEPYICTNAGTGTAEEMSDWVEYCNLETEGQWPETGLPAAMCSPMGSNTGRLATKTMGTGRLAPSRPRNGDCLSVRRRR